MRFPFLFLFFPFVFVVSHTLLCERTLYARRSFPPSLFFTEGLQSGHRLRCRYSPGSFAPQKNPFLFSPSLDCQQGRSGDAMLFVCSRSPSKPLFCASAAVLCSLDSPLKETFFAPPQRAVRAGAAIRFPFPPLTQVNFSPSPSPKISLPPAAFLHFRAAWRDRSQRCVLSRPFPSSYASNAPVRSSQCLFSRITTQRRNEKIFSFLFSAPDLFARSFRWCQVVISFT